MTHIALVRRGDVIGGFANGYRIIMATGTHPDHFIVVHVSGRHRRPLRRGFRMAGITSVAGINVILALATGRCTVMTANTVIHNIGMVHRRR